MIYRVNKMYRTIQGEGRHTGQPVVLVRLQGCGVGCPWCDTKESWDTKTPESFEMDEVQIVQECHRLLEQSEPHPLGQRWILLTGGEPAEQDLSELTRAMVIGGWRVMVESSGTAEMDTGYVDHLCISPKIDMPGGK